uniref:Uncharacterized protein n=1 Tax=Glossina austeni TaxID=7395 RepID=A0A1A9V808_GLOAU
MTEANVLPIGNYNLNVELLNKLPVVITNSILDESNCTYVCMYQGRITYKRTDIVFEKCPSLDIETAVTDINWKITPDISSNNTQYNNKFDEIGSSNNNSISSRRPAYLAKEIAIVCYMN